MLLMKLQNKYSIIRILFFSYIIVSLLPFFAGTISFNSANKIIDEYVSTRAQASANNIASQFNNMISGNSQLVDHIALDKRCAELCESINAYDDVLVIRQLSEKLKTFIPRYGYISDIVIFPFESDYCISSLGMCEKKQFYETYLNQNFSSVDEYFSFINSPSDLTYFKMKPTAYANTFVYCTDLPVFNMKSQAKIFIITNYSSLTSHTLTDSEAFAVMSHGEIIAAYGALERDKYIPHVLQMHKERTESLSNDEFMIMASAPMGDCCEYYFVSDVRSITATKHNYQIISLSTLGFVFLVCMVLIYFFVKLNYTPIRNFTKYVESHFNNIKDDTITYKTIEKGINALDNEITKLNEKNITHLQLISSMQLSQWLKDGNVPPNPQEFFPLDDNSSYIVVNINIKNSNELFFETNMDLQE